MPDRERRRSQKRGIQEQNKTHEASGECSPPDVIPESFHFAAGGILSFSFKVAQLPLLSSTVPDGR